MEACRHCGRYDHSQWRCPEEAARLEQQRRDEQHQSRVEGEQRAQGEAAQRHHERAEAHLEAARQAAERAEEIEREKYEEQSDRQERYEEAASKLHELKRRASALRRSGSTDPTRTWLECGLLNAEAGALGPTDFHPAQQSEFTHFSDTLDEDAAVAATALGPTNVQSLRSWVRLRRDRDRSLLAITRIATVGAPVSLAGAEEELAVLRAQVETFRAQKPPHLPDHVRERFARTSDRFRERVVAELPGGEPTNEAAQQAWTFLTQTRPPGRPSPRSPPSRAVWISAAGVIAIGALFAGVALYAVEGEWADRLWIGGVGYSPVGGLGLVLVVSLVFLSVRARRLEAADQARFDREYDQYSRAVVALVAWDDHVERVLKLGRERESVLQRLAKQFREVEAFDADPQRGGHLQHFERHRPDLVDLVAKVSMFDTSDESDEGAAQDALDLWQNARTTADQVRAAEGIQARDLKNAQNLPPDFVQALIDFGSPEVSRAAKAIHRRAPFDKGPTMRPPHAHSGKELTMRPPQALQFLRNQGVPIDHLSITTPTTLDVIMYDTSMMWELDFSSKKAQFGSLDKAGNFQPLKHFVLSDGFIHDLAAYWNKNA